MSALVFNPTDLVEPTEDDAKLARESARQLAPRLAKAGGALQVQIVDRDGGSEAVTIPTAAFRLLVAILAQMADGNGVRLIPHHAELTTQEAAELLNISRPYLVRLLEEGRIPFRKVGTHRRVRFEDIIAYKAQHRRARSASLDELTRLSQELGLY